MKQIVLVAAENGALPGGKIGGIGDVIRDLPGALADRGWRPTVLTPSYGLFAELPGARQIKRLPVVFGGTQHGVDVYELPGLDKRVNHLVVEHPLFSPGGLSQIYHDDGPDEPFKTDSSKFAFFCAAAAKLLAELGPDLIHLHDWHTGLVLALRAFEPEYAALQAVPTFFTIHNLALQGVRPLAGHPASLGSWFPDHAMDTDVVSDPRYPDCVNPLLTAIRLADGVHTVSPSYAAEILKPNAPGFNGGEGLELALQEASDENRLVGILNGCIYPVSTTRKLGWKRLLKTARAELMRWIAQQRLVNSAHLVADHRLARLPVHRPQTLVTSVGRLTDQKVRILLERTSGGSSALVAILDQLGRDGVFVLLGSGDPGHEQTLTVVAAEHENFLFLRGYSDRLAQFLYQAGDLFLMPSSFEPCGISQMLAMQAGQPCVVHAVGGLKDTVEDSRTGFVFGGNTPTEQATQFVASTRQALRMLADDKDQWQAIRRAAAAQRFTWDISVQAYEQKLYQTDAH